MPSELKVNKLSPYTGSTLTLGDSGDTISLPSGVSLDTLTITGDLTVDTDTLYVDSTDNRVGIGTTSPDQIFHISSTSGVNPIIQRTSDVGNNSTLISLNFKNSDSTVSSITNLNKSGSTKNSNADGYELRLSNNGDGYTSFFNDGSEAMRIDSLGNVGIGTSSPSAKLDVNGNLKAGNTIDFGLADANNTIMNVGVGATGNKFAVTDYIGDTTYTDYGLRVGRTNAGANTDSVIVHRGTGALDINAVDAGIIRFKISNAEQMRIDSSGNVGIGTTSPDAKLEVDGRLRIGAAGGGDTSSVIEFKNDDGELGYIFLDNSENLRFENNGSETMRIDSSGNVGIGTTSPAQKLDVNGQMRMGGVGIEYTGITSGTNNKIAFRWSSPNLSGAVDNVAFFVVGTTSDYRLKNNVENLSSVLDKINLLRPITFNAISLQEGDVVNDANHIGFIAHEVAEHFPSLVEGEKDAVNDEGNNLYQSLNYAGFTPILTKAIQELKADNDALRTTVADLTARLEALENA